MHKVFSIGLSILTCSLFAQDANILDFVDRYKEIAIEEMHRTGIPASIKLAQAILESDAGKSDLATNSNNHFGIKCGVEWDGPVYYKKDDDRDRRGRLIPSCFRVFNSPEASFIAHSDFLMDPRKAYRYGFLFDLDPLDYKSWAWGLKQAGYATNPRYALLLISIIENNELYVLDYYEPQSLLASASEAPIPPPKPTYQHSVLQKRQLQTPLWKQKPEQAPNKIEGIVTNNGLKMVYAHIGDTPASIAKAYNQSVREIITYNEKIEHKEQVLEYTERVYFQKKKRSYKGSIKFHRVEAGETMYDIAQTYGILLEKLYIRNRMFPGTEPAEGEKIRLRGMIKSKDRPKLRYVASKDLAKEEVPAITRHDQQSRKKHVVSVGDTLYGIALEYKLSVDVLKRINKLDSNLIKPGQVLFID